MVSLSKEPLPNSACSRFKAFLRGSFIKKKNKNKIKKKHLNITDEEEKLEKPQESLFHSCHIFLQGR